MAYSNVWNSAAPLGSEDAGLLDNFIRTLKLDLEERMEDVFAIPSITDDPLRLGGLKFRDGADAVINLGDNAGTPRSLLVKNKASDTTYFTFNSAGLTLGVVDLTVNVNKFTVAGATGNVAIAGTLGITGALTATNAASRVTAADKLFTVRTINGTNFDGTANIVITATTTETLTFGTHLTSGGASFNGSAPITISTDATDANTANAIVARSATGRFTATGATFTDTGATGAVVLSLNGKINLNSSFLSSSAANTVVFRNSTGSYTPLTIETEDVDWTVLALRRAIVLGSGHAIYSESGGVYSGFTIRSGNFLFFSAPALTPEAVPTTLLEVSAFGIEAASHINLAVNKKLTLAANDFIWKTDAGPVEAQWVSGGGTVVYAITNSYFSIKIDSSIAAAKKLFFDGDVAGGNTYIWESAADTVQIVAGGVLSATFTGGVVTATSFVGSLTGNASGSAATLATPRNINGVAFDGSANITVTAAAGTLTGDTLAAGVTASSLTSFGALVALTVNGDITQSAGSQHFLDGGGDSYIIGEAVANAIDFYSAGNRMLRILSGTGIGLVLLGDRAITEGAADSGGAGFRLLRVPN